MNRRNLIRRALLAAPAIAAALPVFRQRSRAILSVEEARAHAGLGGYLTIDELSDEEIERLHLQVDEYMRGCRRMITTKPVSWHDFDQDLQDQAAQALAEETDRQLLADVDKMRAALGCDEIVGPYSIIIDEDDAVHLLADLEPARLCRG